MIEKFISESENKNEGWKNVFKKLYEILTCTKEDEDELLEDRKKKGEIRDISQARKPIAGNAFSNLIVYTFLKNKIHRNIKLAYSMLK